MGNEKMMKEREKFLQKAQSLIPELLYEEKTPRCYWMQRGETAKEQKLYCCLKQEELGKGDRILFDFGHNCPAYFQFGLKKTGSPQDAPAFLHFRFCETEREFLEESGEDSGWISRGWIQEEWLHIDELPCTAEMSRRYAFRYVLITVLDTSKKYKISFENVLRKEVSCVDGEAMISALPKCGDSMLHKIREVSIRTLANCMQTVFEDGPKRDRRLWLGDLMLQALVNYETFQKNDLVKRCLYLFAGLCNPEDGMIPACVFEKPVPLMDDSFLLDYSLFFIPVLVEYYNRTGDLETVEELSETAFRQVTIAMKFTENFLIREEGISFQGEKYFCFVDWKEGLDKQCSMQGILLYAVRYGVELCEILGQKEKAEKYGEMQKGLEAAAVKAFWDQKKKVFFSGRQHQISIASQVWMILAGLVQGKEAKELLLRVKDCPMIMVTPYMHHFYVMALLRAGEKEEALKHVKEYWGGMIRAGADTFWELYNPMNEKESPYGSYSVNSYCHAWSCTPVYLLKYLEE